MTVISITETKNRQAKATRIAGTIDALLAPKLATVPVTKRSASMVRLLADLTDEQWAELAELTNDKAPSVATRSIVSTILEERHSVTDPFEGLA